MPTISSIPAIFPVVGYQQNATTAGYKMITPCFEAVGGESYSIQDMSVEGVDDAQATVQVMDADGKWVGEYFWYNAFEEYPAGWFESDGETEAVVNLKPGEAVFFYAPSATKIQTAGEVGNGIALPVSRGYTMVGNGTPVSTNLNKLTLSGASVDDAQVTVQVMDADGKWIGEYFWYNAFEEYPAGWFESDGETEANVELASGASVFIYTPTANIVVNVPSAL